MIIRQLLSIPSAILIQIKLISLLILFYYYFQIVFLIEDYFITIDPKFRFLVMVIFSFRFRIITRLAMSFFGVKVLALVLKKFIFNIDFLESKSHIKELVKIIMSFYFDELNFHFSELILSFFIFILKIVNL